MQLDETHNSRSTSTRTVSLTAYKVITPRLGWRASYTIFECLFSLFPNSS